jgi:hypothetical protein
MQSSAGSRVWPTTMTSLALAALVLEKRERACRQKDGASSASTRAAARSRERDGERDRKRRAAALGNGLGVELGFDGIGSKLSYGVLGNALDHLIKEEGRCGHGHRTAVQEEEKKEAGLGGGLRWG